MRNLPVAQKLLFKNKKKIFRSLHKEYASPPEPLSFVVKLLAYLHIAQILLFLIYLAINRASPWVKLMTLDLRSLAPLFIWLWPMKYGHWETTSRKKCLLLSKNITFYSFR